MPVSVLLQVRGLAGKWKINANIPGATCLFPIFSLHENEKTLLGNFGPFAGL